MKGFIFGLTDNLIVAISALLGIQLDKYFDGLGLQGAIYGALIGHTFSDVLAGYLDFGLSVSINMGLGCLTVLIFVFLLDYFNIYKLK
mgnify:FL=1